ncbi:MAG: cytochrome c oxidase subunit 3 [Terriglobales bacterium]
MGSVSPTLKVREKPAKAKQGGGGRPPVIHFPRYGGGGGGGRDDSYPDFGERLRRYRLGLMIGLAAVVMLFVSFTSAYIVRQGLSSWDMTTQSYVRDWKPVSLPMGLLILNTCILLASSFTIEKARRSLLQQLAVAPALEIPGIAEDRIRPVPWLPITVVLGLGFLVGQLFAWRELARRGFYMASTPSSSFVYVLTGAHAIHLLGGVVALLYALAAAFRPRPLERRRLVVDVTAWYWHFMALLWLYIFALLKFAA